MLRFSTFFVLLMTLCVGTIHIVEAHTDLENAKTAYSIALGEYTQAYGYWETAERQVGDLKNKKDVLSSEWNSNLEDLGENAQDALSINPSDWVNSSGKTVKDLYDSITLSEALSDIQTEIDNIEIGIPQLKSNRDAKKVILDEKRAALRSNQHRCQGCSTYFDTESPPGHGPLLCSANHTYYECDSSAVKRQHTTTTTCPAGMCSDTLLKCQASSHTHTIVCSGCQVPYDPLSSAEIDHRVRYCNRIPLTSSQSFATCGISFRWCDNPRGVCADNHYHRE